MDAISIGAEYRHSDFGNRSYVLGGDVIPTPFATNVKYTTDQGTVRLNWHWH
jgi:opacity protein-like surface antigen